MLGADSRINAQDMQSTMLRNAALINFLKSCNLAPGLGSMSPGDPDNSISAQYFRKQCKTPRLMIGSSVRLQDCVNISEKVANKLNPSFDKLVTNSSSKSSRNKYHHDGMISLSSQLNRTDSFENVNLDGISSDGAYIEPPSDSTNMKVFVSKGLPHANNLIALHEGLFIKEGVNNVFTAPSTIRAITDFIKENLPTDKKLCDLELD